MNRLPELLFVLILIGVGCDNADVNCSLDESDCIQKEGFRFIVAADPPAISGPQRGLNQSYYVH